MWCFEGEELDLLQRHEIRTAEKSFMCHSNFTQGSHDVDVDNALRNNTVHVDPSCHDICLFVKQRDRCLRVFLFYRFIRFEQISCLVRNFINKPTWTLSSFNEQRMLSG